MVQVLCPYCIDKSEYNRILVQCTINNMSQCYNVRYCRELGKPTMTNNYLQYGCKIKNNYEKDVEMGRRKKSTIESKKPVINKVAEKVEKPVVVKQEPKPAEPVINTVVNKEPVKENRKTVCKVNYYSRNLKQTSITYMNYGKECSLFVTGEYHGSVEVEYTDILNTKNIIKVRQL